MDFLLFTKQINNNFYGKALRAVVAQRSPFSGHCNANAPKLLSIETKEWTEQHIGQTPRNTYSSP